MGDDTTDLDAFRALEKLREDGVLSETLRIRVKSEEGPQEIISEADLVVNVEYVAEVEVLRALAGDWLTCSTRAAPGRRRCPLAAPRPTLLWCST